MCTPILQRGYQNTLPIVMTIEWFPSVRRAFGQQCIRIVVCDAYEVWQHLAGYEVGTATFAMESKQAKQTN